MTDLSNGAAILTLNDDLEKSPKERLDLFYKFVAACKKAGGVPSIARDLVKIKAEAERLDVMEKAPGILAELIYSKNLLKEIKDYRPIMLHVRQWVTGVGCTPEGCWVGMCFHLFQPVLVFKSVNDRVATRLPLCLLSVSAPYLVLLSSICVPSSLWTIPRARRPCWVHLRSLWGRSIRSCCPVLATY